MKPYEIFLTIYASLHLLSVCIYAFYVIVNNLRSRTRRDDRIMERLNDLEESICNIHNQNNDEKTY
jgi:hypothetical protein